MERKRAVLKKETVSANDHSSAVLFAVANEQADAIERVITSHEQQFFASSNTCLYDNDAIAAS